LSWFLGLGNDTLEFFLLAPPSPECAQVMLLFRFGDGASDGATIVENTGQQGFVLGWSLQKWEGSGE
jgi:hypothetical protein